ncbi:MAG: YbhN family protein [Anaerolineales bacterium]
MRNFVIAVFILIGVVFILFNLTEVQSIIDTLQDGNLVYIFLALGLEIIYLLNVTGSYRAIYSALGLNEKSDRLFLMAASANFVNVGAPSGGVGGLGIFISEARRNQYSSARVTVAGALVVLFDYLGFLSLLGLGLTVLFRRDNLNSAEIVASILMVLLVVSWIGLLYLGMRSEKSLGRLLARLAILVNTILKPFIRRKYLSEKRAFVFARDVSEGLNYIRYKPLNLILPAILGLTSKIVLMVILAVIFLAFNVPFSTGTIVAVFSLGYLFWIISPTPSGIGFVEGALTLGLTSLQVPLGAAAVIALAYRGVTFWFPMLIGMLAIRWLFRGKSIELAV